MLQLQRTPLSDMKIPLRRMIQFRQSITRLNIDPSDFTVQKADSILVRNIRDSVTDLVEDIEGCREQRWA